MVKKKTGFIPRLDQYIRPGKLRRYADYYAGARLYSLSYYGFVNAAKAAGATRNIRKSVLVDLDVFEEYMERQMMERMEI